MFSSFSVYLREMTDVNETYCGHHFHNTWKSNYSAIDLKLMQYCVSVMSQ